MHPLGSILDSRIWFANHVNLTCTHICMTPETMTSNNVVFRCALTFHWKQSFRLDMYDKYCCCNGTTRWQASCCYWKTNSVLQAMHIAQKRSILRLITSLYREHQKQIIMGNYHFNAMHWFRRNFRIWDTVSVNFSTRISQWHQWHTSNNSPKTAGASCLVCAFHNIGNIFLWH